MYVLLSKIFRPVFAAAKFIKAKLQAFFRRVAVAGAVLGNTENPQALMSMPLCRHSLTREYETPNDFVNVLNRRWSTVEEKHIRRSLQPKIYQNSHFHLCVLHMWLHGRERFGVFGWQHTYDFCPIDVRWSGALLGHHFDQPEALRDLKSAMFEVQWILAHVVFGHQQLDWADARRLEHHLAHVFKNLCEGALYKIKP